jgi:S1-C subfamily serine protease
VATVLLLLSLLLGFLAYANADDPGVPDVVRRVEPSVVSIFTRDGLGSGVIWSSDGLIVTDHHVVAGNEQVEVAFADGRRAPARVLAGDPVTDLAVLQAERAGLPQATFQAERAEVGEQAIAIGTPLGFERTVTAGIVSGLYRTLPNPQQPGQMMVDLLQTDAAISPGNSGGALVNADAEVIGINEAYIPPSMGAVAIGFATPTATVIDVVEELLRDGRASHAFLGIQPAPITTDVAERLGMDQSSGVLVLDVVSGGPAAAAGVEPGDVIIALDGTPVAGIEEFLAALRALDPGEQAELTLVRGDRPMTAQATLVEQPPSPPNPGTQPQGP